MAFFLVIFELQYEHMNQIKTSGLIILIVILSACNKQTEYISNTGYLFGTTYSFKYQHKNDLQEELMKELQVFNRSLSTYDKESIISKINTNDPDVRTDAYFESCYQTATTISELTNGAFDMTIAPVVNAWGFGFDESIEADSSKIDSLMQFVGYKTILLKGHKLIKEKLGTQLDASAIAKGMGVDVAALILEKHGITDYMVEIGGEVRSKGINHKGNLWRIGIDKPIEGASVNNRQLQAVVSLKNKSLATSGNYRQFYEKDGIKYSHTINPQTGYPARSAILSASVLSPSCMSADAFATAFMVMGVDKSIELANELDSIDIYLIYMDTTQQYQIYASEGFKAFLN